MAGMWSAALVEPPRAIPIVSTSSKFQLPRVKNLKSIGSKTRSKPKKTPGVRLKFTEYPGLIFPNPCWDQEMVLSGLVIPATAEHRQQAKAAH